MVVNIGEAAWPEAQETSFGKSWCCMAYAQISNVRLQAHTHTPQLQLFNPTKTEDLVMHSNP